jgi:hypothetical protein
MLKKKTLTISIPQPCHEDWNSMTETERGKFCSACKKEVLDFTKLTDTELLTLIRINKYQLCGKFSESQLNRKIAEQSRNFTFNYKKIAASLIAIASFKFSNSQSISKPKFDTTLSPVAKQNISTENSQEYIIHGKITSDDPILLLVDKPVIKIGNKAIAPDSLGFYKIVLNQSDIKEYTIISFNHSILKREVRSIHKSNFPVELNVTLTNQYGGTLMGVPIFDENGNIPHR